MEAADGEDYRARIEACQAEVSVKTPLVLEEYINPNGGHLTVVRDDILCGGTKSRILYSFLTQHLITQDGVTSKLIDKYSEFVYISPWYGGAQVALSWVCMTQLYWTQATIILQAPSEMEEETMEVKLHFGGGVTGTSLYIPPYTRIALQQGAKVIYSHHPEVYARSYVGANTNAYLLASGFNYPLVETLISTLAGKINRHYDECWCAVGSGTLIRSLQRADLATRYFGVCVFQACPDIGAAARIIPPTSFDQVAEVKPPFPSSSHYDAKVWEYLAMRKGDILFWNVM